MIKIKTYRYLITNYFNSGHERSVKAKKNIVITVIIRLISVFISFLLVPLTIHYVNTESYGVWLALSSIVGWASFFNLGINNGLRNKLTESLAIKDLDLSQKYVSTTYALLTLIFVPLFFIFIIVGNFLNWNSILNSPHSLRSELYLVAVIVFGYFCIRFILSTINIILLSNQTPAGESARSLIEQSFSLLIIFILTKTTQGSLLNLSIGLCVAPLFILLYFNIALFRKKYKEIRPKLSQIDFSKSKDLLGLGIRFFIIQIAGIVQFQTANFIIINSFTPTDVTVYNIAFKYFSILTMVFGIFMTPLWSAVTDAYVKKDYSWITNTVKKYQRLTYLFALVGFVMLVLSKFAYNIWLGKDVINIPFSISFWMFVFTTISITGGLYSGVLNGISALRIQFYASILSPIIFIGLIYLFIYKLNLGIEFIIISTIIANFNGSIIGPIQYHMIFIRKKNNHLWYK